MWKRQLCGLMGVLGLFVLVGCATQPAALTVRPVGSELAFQPATLQMVTGSTVALTFENAEDFSHNFILVNGDEATVMTVDAGGDAAGESGGYIPVGVPGMIAHTQLLLPGNTGF